MTILRDYCTVHVKRYLTFVCGGILSLEKLQAKARTSLNFAGIRVT